MARHWTVAGTRSASSGEAIRNISAQGFQYYHPKFRDRPHRGARKILPLFPRYIFVRIDPRRDNWRALCSTRDVSRLFMFGDEPARVPDREIEYIMGLENEHGYVEHELVSAPRFEPGQVVVGMRGLFEDKIGKYQGVGSNSHRVRVLFEILGRSTTFEVSAYDLAASAA